MRSWPATEPLLDYFGARLALQDSNPELAERLLHEVGNVAEHCCEGRPFALGRPGRRAVDAVVPEARTRVLVERVSPKKGFDVKEQAQLARQLGLDPLELRAAALTPEASAGRLVMADCYVTGAVTNGGVFVVQARNIEIVEHAKSVKTVQRAGYYRHVIEKEEIFAPGPLEFVVNNVDADSWLLSQSAISVIGYVAERPVRQGVQAVSFQQVAQQAHLVILPVLTRPRAPRTWLEDVN